MNANVHERNRIIMNACSNDARRFGGRPLDRGKDAAILDAACTAFFERGFAATAIEDVAHRAGVSKVTIYKRFADKDALFEAVVRNEVAKMEAALEHWPVLDGSLRERLNAYGSILLRFLFSSQHMLLDRMLAHDLAHSPDMGRRFFDAGPGACRRRMADMIAEAAAAGELSVDEPELAAVDLFSLWTGFLQKELDFRVIDPPPGDALDRRVERGTRLFLKMYTPA